MAKNSYNQSVFINCPFDDEFKPLFRAAVFTVLRCGYTPRSAQELEDSSEPRLNKIFQIIEECRYGIHDLSRVELDDGLPRFNMPFELGLFFGAKRYGNEEQGRKSCLIFERNAHSYERFISDIKGQDVATHENKPKVLIRRIRDWLSTNKRRRSLPGGAALWHEYTKFKRWLPIKCREEDLKDRELTWDDYLNLLYKWVEDGSSGYS
ncbi:MAG: hypothetical protein IH830_09330 [Planctomycetes bacterium]|nr:hypothetical protein [Planctomycetota bacterium]